MNPDTDRWVRSDEARSKLRDLLDEVAQDDAHIYVLRYDKPVAVIVSADWHEAATAFISRTEEEIRAFAKWQDRNAALRRARRLAGLRPKDSRVVHHIDGNPYNNDPANLEIREPNQ